MPKLLLSLVAALLLAGCGPVEVREQRALDGEKIQVVATIGMIGDVVERVGGDRVEVEGLMGPGVDPHLYKASEGDMRRLERADVDLLRRPPPRGEDGGRPRADRRAARRPQAVTDAIPTARC